MYGSPGTDNIQVQIYFYVLEKKKKRARSFLLLSLRQEEMSLFGLYGFFTVAGNLLTFT